MASGSRETKRSDLFKRLRELESEFARVQSELASSARGEPLPGLYLAVEVQGFAAAVPAALVSEIVRLIECTPLPDAPRHVLGTFLYRGEPAVAVDLAAFLGHGRPARVDAHVVVLSTTRRLALVVDRVRALIEAPELADPDRRDDRPEAWYSSQLVRGVCRNGDELLPLLNVEVLLSGVPAP